MQFGSDVVGTVETNPTTTPRASGALDDRKSSLRPYGSLPE